MIPVSDTEMDKFLCQWFQEDLHTALPGRVKTYNAAEKTATIELQVTRVMYDIFDAVALGKDEPFPLLPRVPVGQMAGGGFFMHLPVEPGDFVWVFFSARSIDRYRHYGRVEAPNDVRQHSLAHGFAIPVYDPAKMRTPPQYVAGKLVMGKLDGPVIAWDSEVVNLGDATAADFIAKAGRVLQELQSVKADFNAIRAIFNTHTHEGPGGPTDPPNAPFPAPHDPTSVATTKVKAT